jgi:hypothetical protein
MAALRDFSLPLHPEEDQSSSVFSLSSDLHRSKLLGRVGDNDLAGSDTIGYGDVGIAGGVSCAVPAV